MARRVLMPGPLGALCILISVSLAACARRTEPRAAGCISDSLAQVQESSRKAARELLQQTEAGAFYKELALRFGRPVSCTIASDEIGIRLSYVFRDNGRLEARINPSIEFAEQRMQLLGITAERALELLKAAESGSFGREGCGIQWSRGADESSDGQDSREIVYRGDICNCQARVTYQGQSVIGLTLRSTC